MADLTFSTEELAQSCSQAFRAALALSGETWEKQALEKHVPWLRLSKLGPPRLESLEGFSYQHVARELWLLTLGEGTSEASEAWEHFPREFHLAWQAVTRHLMTLLDADDLENVPELEQSWRQWLLEKCTPQEAAR